MVVLIKWLQNQNVHSIELRRNMLTSKKQKKTNSCTHKMIHINILPLYLQSQLFSALKTTLFNNLKCINYI